MRTLEYVALPLVILLLSATGLSASDAELTASEIRSRIIGNTIVGIENGKYYEEYLQPNGVIAGRGQHEVYRGWWRLEGNQLCFAYEDDGESDGPVSKSWDCSPVSLVGDRLRWPDDGTTARLVGGRVLSSLRAFATPGQQASGKRN